MPATSPAASRQHPSGGAGHLPEDVHGEVVRCDGYGFLVHDPPRVGLGHHLVERRSGFAFALDDGPVDRDAPAVLGKEGSVHVERTAPWDRQERLPQHHPIVEGEQEVRRQGANPVDDRGSVGVFGSDRLDALFAREPGDAGEPDVFCGSVAVGEDQRHVDAVVEQNLEAAAADVVIREYDGTGHSFRSSIAWMT